ncbi:MAG: hypothetical protein ACI85U_002294, partial [Candidatus Promineifilaceae bacterium]
VFDELSKLPKTVPPYLGGNRFFADFHQIDTCIVTRDQLF